MKHPATPATPRLLVPPELPDLLESLEGHVIAQEQALAAARESLAKRTLELTQAQQAGAARPAGSQQEDVIDAFREPFAKCMAEISVAIWRIRQSAERLEENKETRRIQRDITNCVEALKALGIVIVDRSGADLNNGTYRDIEVITNEVSPEVSSVTVAEMLKPAVHFSVRHDLLRKDRERPDQPPFIIQKCQVVTKSPPPSES